MCRTSLAPLAGALALALLVAGCNRQETRTVVLDPATGRQAAPAAPPAVVPPTPPVAAPSPPVRAEAPVPESPPPVAARPGDDAASLLAARRPIIPVEGIPPDALRDNY